MLLLIGVQKSITHPWPRIATCNAGRFGKWIGEPIHVNLISLLERNATPHTNIKCVLAKASDWLGKLERIGYVKSVLKMD
jgi:hypothetical protein